MFHACDRNKMGTLEDEAIDELMKLMLDKFPRFGSDRNGDYAFYNDFILVTSVRLGLQKCSPFCGIFSCTICPRCIHYIFISIIVRNQVKYVNRPILVSQHISAHLSTAYTCHDTLLVHHS